MAAICRAAQTALISYALMHLWPIACCASPSRFPESTAESSSSGSLELTFRKAFEGAQIIDLRRCRVSSVVMLRDVIKIPPPRLPVLVKRFKRDQLPKVLRPVFSRRGAGGATIHGRYVAILETDFQKEYEDILRHELVHAYITLASPKPLPFWFQEASAVMFSTGKVWKFYGKPSESEPRMIVGKIVELDPSYRQKLQSFDFLLEKAGKEKFYRWYRKCVITGNVDPRELLGRPAVRPPQTQAVENALPTWLWIGSATVVVLVLAVGLYISRRESAG